MSICALPHIGKLFLVPSATGVIDVIRAEEEVPKPSVNPAVNVRCRADNARVPWYKVLQMKDLHSTCLKDFECLQNYCASVTP